MADATRDEMISDEMLREVPVAENVTTNDGTGPVGPEVMEDSTAPEQQSDGLPPETDNLDEKVQEQESDGSQDKSSSGQFGPAYVKVQPTVVKEPVWPIKNGYRVFRYYDKTHGGVDFDTGGKTGVNVVAYRSGVVADVVNTPRGKGSGYCDYGKVVVIKHSKNKYSLYAHLASIVKGLKKGDKVTADKPIGIAGQTGAADGIHLHFELRPAPGIGHVPREKRINPFTKNINSTKYLK